MKQTLIFFSLGLFLFIFSGCEKTDNLILGVDDLENTGTIEGEVLAIDGVVYEVQLLQNGQLIAETRTDTKYEFSEIEAGDYKLQITAEGYKDIQIDITVSASLTITLDTVQLEKSLHPNGLDIGQGLKIGTQAPEFELPDGNEELHSLTEHLENGKHVVLVFYRFGG